MLNYFGEDWVGAMKFRAYSYFIHVMIIQSVTQSISQSISQSVSQSVSHSVRVFGESVKVIW